MRVPKLRNPIAKRISLTGGLDESTNFQEMPAGALTFCENVVELGGSYTGYTSAWGYERWDGSRKTITDPNDQTNSIEVGPASDVPVVWNSDYTDADDTARETRRGEIIAPPNTDKILGYFKVDDRRFVAGMNLTTSELVISEEDATAGWVNVVTAPAPDYDPNETYYLSSWQGRFSYFQSGVLATVLFTGFTEAQIFYIDDLGNLQNGTISSTVLPTTRHPQTGCIFNNRLFLAYNKGELYFSSIGDPFEYDPSVSTAGAFSLHEEAVDFLVMPSSLIVALKRGIDIIKKSDPNLQTGVDMTKETYSDSTRVKRGTLQRMMGTAFFCDERGIGRIEAAQDYGDFTGQTLTRKIQRTYLKYKDHVVSAFVDRKRAQYWVLMDSGIILVLTFTAEKRVKGVTVLDLKRPIECGWADEAVDWKFFSFSDSNYVFAMHEECTSFDGQAIHSEFTLAYHHYRTPNRNKNFLSVILEFTASKGRQFQVKPLFDYEVPDVPSAAVYTTAPAAGTDRYGEAIWGERVYGGSGEVSVEHCYINGFGRNMALHITSDSKFHLPFTVHDIIVNYISAGHTL